MADFGNLLSVNQTTGPPNPTNQLAVTSAQGSQNLLQNAPAMSTPLFSQQQQFQAQFSPMIEMASNPELQQGLYTPGRSMVGGQFGEGGLLNTQRQGMVNQAAIGGMDAQQKMVNKNLQHAMTAEGTQAKADMNERTQRALLLSSALQPAAAGVAAGYNTGVNSMLETTPFFKG